MRRQMWLMVVLLSALGVAATFLYRHVRAGNIQSAEGRRAYDVGRFANAEDAYQRATQANPKNADAWYWLGMSRKNQGKSDAAADALEHATSLRPNESAWWMEYAQVLQWSKRYPQAQKAWERLLTLLPPSDQRVRQIRIYLAQSMAAQGQTGPAVELLEKMLAEKDDRETRFALAELLAWAGRFDESTAQYRRALGTTSAPQ